VKDEAFSPGYICYTVQEVGTRYLPADSPWTVYVSKMAKYERIL